MRAKEDKMWCPDCQLAESAAAKEAREYLLMKKRKGAMLGKAQRLVEALLAENEQLNKRGENHEYIIKQLHKRIVELENGKEKE